MALEANRRNQFGRANADEKTLTSSQRLTSRLFPVACPNERIQERTSSNLTVAAALVWRSIETLR